MSELPIGHRDFSHMDEAPQPGHQHGGKMLHISDYWKGAIAALGVGASAIALAAEDGFIMEDDIGPLAAAVGTFLFVVFGPRNTINGRQPE